RRWSPRSWRAIVCAPCGALRVLLGGARRAQARLGLVNGEPGDGQHGEEEHEDRARDAPDADGLDGEDLAVREVRAEARADDGQAGRGGHRGLTGDEQRREDPDVAEEAEQRDGHAGDLGPLGGLDLLAAVGDLAHRADAGVVHVGEVAGDRDPHDGDRDRGGTEPVAHDPTAAFSAAGRPGASTALRVVPPRARNVGVSLTPVVFGRSLAALSWAETAAPSRAFRALAESRPGTAPAMRWMYASVA